MADADVTDLTAVTTLASTDLLYTATASGTLDRKITADDAATALAGLAGYTLIDDDGLVITSGDITLNTTTVSNLTGTQLTLSGALTGDVVYLEMSALISNVAQTKVFEAYTYVSGTRTNPFGNGITNSAATAGHMGWYGRGVAEDTNLGGRARKVLVSGDISGGNVVVGIAHVGATATSRTLYASTSNPLEVSAQLWRPPT